MAFEGNNNYNSKEITEKLASEQFDKTFIDAEKNNGAETGKAFRNGDNEITIETQILEDGSKNISITERNGKSNGAATNEYVLTKDKNGNFRFTESGKSEIITKERLISEILPKIREQINNRDEFQKSSSEFNDIMSEIGKINNGEISYHEGDKDIIISIIDTKNGGKSIAITERNGKSNGAATNEYALTKDQEGNFLLENNGINTNISIKELSDKILDIKNNIKKSQEYQKATKEFEKFFTEMEEKNYTDKVFKEGNNEFSINIINSQDGNKSITITERNGKSNGAATNEYILTKNKEGSFTLENNGQKNSISIKDLLNKITNIEDKISNSNEQNKADKDLEIALNDLD